MCEDDNGLLKLTITKVLRLSHVVGNMNITDHAYGKTANKTRKKIADKKKIFSVGAHHVLLTALYLTNTFGGDL